MYIYRKNNKGEWRILYARSDGEADICGAIDETVVKAQVAIFNKKGWIDGLSRY